MYWSEKVFIANQILKPKTQNYMYFQFICTENNGATRNIIWLMAEAPSIISRQSEQIWPVRKYQWVMPILKSA